MTRYQRPLSWALCVLVALTTLPLQSGGMVFYQAGSSTTAQEYTGQGEPYTPEELQGMVAPIALYPDALVAQILDAATYPDQVATADNWMQQNKNLTGTALMAAVNGQAWDPSVKALTEFPTVLNNMSQNLVWTSQLGEAYHNQQADVMSAIQGLRAKALAAGKLKSSTQMTVVQPSPDVIQLVAPNPTVVYVPEYNPAVIYGTPIQTPNYTTGDVAAGSLLAFGSGVAIGALMSGGCCDWGWSAWSCSWYHGGAYYHGYPYYGNNAWHGGYYGGYNHYGNHTYNSSYDYNHPYSAYQSAAYHSDAGSSAYNRTGDTTTNRSATAGASNVNRPATTSSSWDRSSGGWSSADDARGWGQAENRGSSTAFSSWGNHSGSSDFGGGGWGERSSSSRGWGSRGSGGGWGGGSHFGGGRR